MTQGEVHDKILYLLERGGSSSCIKLQCQRDTHLKKTTPRGASKPSDRNDVCRSKTSHTNTNDCLKPGPNAGPTSHNISDSTLASVTDTFAESPGRELYQTISSGNLEDVIKLIQTSDGKTNDVEQSTLDQGLLMACSGGRKFVVRHLLLKGASTETRDPMGNTPLLVSVERGFVDIARLLLDKGADVNATNICDDSASTLFMGNTPLLVSVEKGFIEIARLLLDKGADVNASNIRGDSALTLSVRTCGSKDMIGLLLKQKSVNVNHRNKDGYTCWMKAVEALDFDALKLLIKSRKNINKNGNDCKGQTSRKLSKQLETDSNAIKCFNVDAIISLIEHEEKGYESSLRLAVFQRDLYSARFLIDYGIYDAKINKYDTELLVDFMEDIEDKQSKQCPFSKTELEIIRKLLETGADVYLRNSHRDDEVLVKAVNIGSYELVDLLCQHGADPNTQSSKSPYQNAVLAAVEKGRCDLLKVLIKYNANIHSNNVRLHRLRLFTPTETALQSGKVNEVKVPNKNNRNNVNVEAGLHIAVTHKRLESLRFLVGEFLDLSRSAIHNNSKGLIHKAVETGDVDIINTLLDLGSDVNCLFDGKTPLMHADTPQVMELLIKRGAEVHKQTATNNILSYIILRESKKTSQRDLKRGEERTDKSPSPQIHLKDMVELLLRSGARVNDTDSRGQTPLMVAAKQSDAEGVLKILVESGAEVNKVDSKGVGALHEAVVGGCLKNVEILIKLGADVNQKCNDGRTALHAAIHNEAILGSLIQNGADLDAQDAGGNTALLTAIKSNRDENSARILKMLLEAGSNVNHRNANGETALMKAACCLNDEAIKALCEANADVNMRSLDNMNDAISTLVNRLCKSQFTLGEVRDSIFYLLDRGGSSSCVSLQNLYYLISNGFLIIVQRLVEAGLGPSDIDAQQLPFRHRKLLSAKNVSPFCFALLCNEVKLARYFSDIWYLTNSDVTSLAQDEIIRLRLECQHLNESLKFLEEFSSQPMSLQTLCFVAVSTSIGTGPDREQKIRDLPLPNKFKDKLRFKGGSASEPRFDDDQRGVKLLPDRANFVLGLWDLFCDSDESDFALDSDYENDYDYENYFDYYGDSD
ncbi:unnamed protein product [Lymnaea stagnalis]|uniref:SOCS box domain-containing protein n=1 Tax=Lymnaea stagnalis TaxID=6523 RepID=A0AAV2IAN2_LYMST